MNLTSACSDRFALLDSHCVGSLPGTLISCCVQVVQKVMEMFQPSAVVLQCGADSLTGDRLGCFNMTLHGHADCVKFVKSFGLPTLVLGGGGYNIRNVSRCWTYETAVVLDQEISNNIPYNDFFQYYGPDYCLHLTPTEMPNKNDRDYLEDLKCAICLLTVCFVFLAQRKLFLQDQTVSAAERVGPCAIRPNARGTCCLLV
jgi:hypothetical protein